ncbi:MAG: twin-arginine translocase TatA/TatE family subunit [Firmicutes bacterium]|nr:twin-arginine translocase TatA/TatE family subunit [Bacillota bacterium]
MMNFSFWDIILILIVSLIVFGPNKLPDVAKSMGKGMAEFRKMADQAQSVYKKETDSLKNEVEDVTKEPDAEPAKELNDKKDKKDDKIEEAKNTNN